MATKENAVVKIKPIYAADGVTAEGATITVGERTETVSFGDLSPEIVAWATYFGLQTKIRNGAAIGRNAETGQPASEEEKADGVFGQLEQLLSGEWRASKGESGGAGPRGGGMLYEAFKRLFPNDDKTASPAAFADFLKAFGAKQFPNEDEETQLANAKKVLGAQSKVKPILDAIKAERAAQRASKATKSAPEVDVEEMFS